MTEQTDAAEVEALAAVLSDIDNQPRMGTYPRQALALLSSDWLAARRLPLARTCVGQLAP
jgi:hypothetical protein